MAKVTSKLQVTIPKALAERSGIKPGDEIEWVEGGDGLRIKRVGTQGASIPIAMRLELFDYATAREAKRHRVARIADGNSGRGWKRADLYDRAVAQ